MHYSPDLAHAWHTSAQVSIYFGLQVLTTWWVCSVMMRACGKHHPTRRFLIGSQSVSVLRQYTLDAVIATVLLLAHYICRLL
jgi:hypothetical protein